MRSENAAVDTDIRGINAIFMYITHIGLCIYTFLYSYISMILTKSAPMMQCDAMQRDEAEAIQ